MRRLVLIPVLLLTFVSCQQAAPPQFATYRPPIHGGFTGEIRPILAPLSVQFGPHENVRYEWELTYEETIDGKTDTYKESARFSSSAKRVGDALMRTLDINELSSSTAKSLGEMSREELLTRLRETQAGIPSAKESRGRFLPRPLTFEPPEGAEGLPLARLHMLISPKGRVKDVSMDFPAFEAVGRAGPKPGSKEYEDTAKELQRFATATPEFNEKPVGVGDKLYRTRSAGIFGDAIRAVSALPDWIVLGLTTYSGRPCIVTQMKGTLMLSSETGEIPARTDGYSLIDLQTGLALDGGVRITVDGGTTYYFEAVARFSARI